MNVARWWIVGAAAVALALAAVLRGCARGTEVPPPSVAHRAEGGVSLAAHGAARPRRRSLAAAADESVRVTVRTLTGEPVSGATVRLFPGPAEDQIFDSDSFRPSAHAVEPSQSLTASHSGTVSFDGIAAGRWFVAADAPGFGRRAVAVTRGADGAAPEVWLAPGTRFGGSLRDADGAPMAGIDVILAPTQRSMTWPSDAACLRTSTDGAGAWTFDAVAAGEYRVWVRAEPEALVDEGRVRVPALDRFDIRLARGAVIEGVVADADTGAPLAGARVNLRSGDQDDPDLGFVVCDAAGRFACRTHLAEARVDAVLVDADGYAPAPVDASGELHPSRLRDGQTARLAVRVRRGFVVTGVVRGPEGPLAGVVVNVEPEVGTARRATTDAEGRYRADRVSGGPAQVDVRRTDRWWDEMPRTAIVVAEGTTADVAVPATRVVITGRVTDETGAPIEGASVRHRAGPLTSTTVSAADGSYALPLWSFAGAESAGLQITAEGHEIDWLGFSVADRVAEVAELHQPSTRIGFVRDGEGRPVAGARVEVVSGNAGQDCYIFRWPGSAEVITDAAGRFEVTAATGREDLVRPFAPAAGTSWNWRPWQTRDDAQRDVPLAGVSRARGRVVARDTGAPVAGALVRMGTHRSWAAAVGRTDARGAFDVPIVPPEGERRHELYVAAHGFIEHEFTPGTAADLVELVPAVAVLGRLLDDEDRPVVNEEVRATQTGVDDDVAVSDECRTDSDGRFVFRALAAGRYMLVDRGSGRSRGNVEIEVVAGMTGVVMRRAAEEPVPDEPPSPPEPDDER